ncbi:MAG: hypothetical protein GXO39_01530 [Thermotogae bacterium]|nr:hypothetical protein [Thermotogota bacterium]
MLKKCETLDQLLEVAKIVYEQYERDGYIPKNPFHVWLSPFQLLNADVLYEPERKFTVTAVYEDIPAKINFPDVIARYDKKAELIMLASKSKRLDTMKLLVEACRHILNKGVENLFIEVVPEKARLYKLIGFKELARGGKHFCLDKTPVLLHFPLKKYERHLNGAFLSKFVKQN